MMKRDFGLLLELIKILPAQCSKIFWRERGPEKTRCYSTDTHHECLSVSMD